MKKTIGKRFLTGLVIFTVIQAVAVSMIVSWSLKKRIISEYEYVGASITRMIAKQIDGDKAMNYLKAGIPDEYYNEILDEINLFSESFDVLYIYVAVPETEQMLYIWSNGFSGDETIGFRSGITSAGEEYVRGIMAGTEENILFFDKDPQFGKLATAAEPILDSAGNSVAAVCVDFSVNEINGVVANMVITICISIAVLMIIYVVIYYWYIKRMLITPLKELTSSVDALTENIDKDVLYKSQIHTGDELELLSDSFEKMNHELRDYITENLKISAEKERVNAEVNMASDIQESQLPHTFPPFPGQSEFEIYAFMNPAKTVGGDFYDFFMPDDDHIALVIADVSGKGIPGALFMMVSKSLIKNSVLMRQSAGEALHDVNRQLAENNETMHFVTVWLAIITLSTGEGVAVNAGHENPAIKRADGGYELIENQHSLPIAIMEDAVFEEHEFKLYPGDRIFVYTDGVAEAKNADDELFGTDRMLEALNKASEAGPQDIIDSVKSEIDAFVAGYEQFDDITMLSFKYNGAVGDNE